MEKTTKQPMKHLKIVKEKKVMTIEDAITEVKANCKCKFDSTIEAHFNLSIDPQKTEQNVRFTTTLPHGTGKTKKVAVFASKKIPNADLELTESDLDKIASGAIKPNVDFDVLVAEPKFMVKLAKVAKILGPAGCMPNPKTGTVSENVEKAVEQIKKGKVEIRSEPNGKIAHTIIGKRSFETQKLLENFNEILTTLNQNKPAKVKGDLIASCYVTSTMSPSVQVSL